MTLENARVLRLELLKVDRTIAAKDIERRYPELAEIQTAPEPIKKSIDKMNKKELQEIILKSGKVFAEENTNAELIEIIKGKPNG